MSSGKVILGTVAGLAIGAIAGILFAPEKGSTTRKQIIDKSADYVDELKSKFDEFRNSITEKIESTKKNTQEIVDKGKTNYDEMKNEVKNASSDYKQNSPSGIKHAI